MARRLLVMLAMAGASTCAIAQETEGQINPNSIIPIPKYEQLYKVRVWREIDLREKQNKGFFAKGNEITKLILTAIKSGELADVYQKDSLTTRIPKDEFNASMVSVQGTTYPAWSPTQDFYFGDRATINGKNYEALTDNRGKNPETSPDDWQATTAGKAIEFLPSEIYKLTMMEDLIFDRRRSRLYYDIQAIQLQVFDLNTGIFKPLGWLKYKDLEKLFRNHPDEAIWFNRYNSAENKNYADAFLLRLFHGTIAKVENPDNETILDTYSFNNRPYKESVWAREWEEMKLMEREHNLWEY
ncbi:MAG: gliding motility protein GldN [Cyclobacteriaceae bacterium]